MLDETANSTTSSNEAKDAVSDASPSAHHVQGGSSTGNSAHSATPHSSPSHLMDESDIGAMDTSEPRSQLDTLLRLEDQRLQTGDPRDKSHSPDENLNVSNFPKLFGPTQDFAALFGLTSLLPSGSNGSQTTSTSSGSTNATATATVTIKNGSELAKALGGKQNGRQSNTFSQLDLGSSKLNNFMQEYVKNNWQMPEDCKFFFKNCK